MLASGSDGRQRGSSKRPQFLKSYYDHVVAPSPDVDQLSGPASYKSVQAKTKSKSISVVTSSKGVHQRPRAEPLVAHHQPKVYPVYPSQEISGVGGGSLSPSVSKVKSVIGENTNNNKFKSTRHEINAVHHFSTRPYSRWAHCDTSLKLKMNSVLNLPESISVIFRPKRIISHIDLLLQFLTFLPDS